MMRLKAKHIGPIGRIRRIGEAVDYAVMYVYDGDHIIAEYSGSGGTPVLVRKYVYGPGIDQPVAMINIDGESETWYYYHQDALGSVVALSNSNGNLVERYRYTPFGKQSVYNAADTYIGTASAYGNPYMFTARRYDTETGLYYYRARMYSPTLGRFLQTDPIGYFDSMNLYQYCGNNPGNWVDPFGLMDSVSEYSKRDPETTAWAVKQLGSNVPKKVPVTKKMAREFARRNGSYKKCTTSSGPDPKIIWAAIVSAVSDPLTDLIETINKFDDAVERNERIREQYEQQHDKKKISSH